MSASKSIEQKRKLSQGAEKTSANLPSSQGDSPKEITPKEVMPHHATWTDIAVRETTSADTEVKQEALLDEAVDQSFPASDPVADLPSQPNASGQLHLVWEDEEEELLDEAIEMTFPASDPIAIAEPSRQHWTAKTAHPKT